MTSRLSHSLLLLVAACASPTGEDVGHGEDAIRLPFSFETPSVINFPAPPPPTIDVLPGCDRNVLVGIAENSSSCPPANGNWAAVSPFASLRTVQGNAMCRYEFSGPRSLWSTDGLPSDAGFSGFVYVETPPEEWLEPDCNAVVPLGDPTVDQTLEVVTSAHQAAWREHMDRVSVLPTIEARPGNDHLPQEVVVAILDDVPEGNPDDLEVPITGTSHGQSVALAIRDIVCPTDRPGECPIHFKSYPVIQPDSDIEGSVFNLAGMIMRATDEGASVINLSVGFDGRYAWHGDENDKTYYERARILREALQYAACHGVIAVAAAGNDGRGRDVGQNDSPMYPAAFAAENRRDCSTGAETAQPLVYIASGVGPGDEDVPNTRPGSRGELAAPAFAVTFHDRRPGAPEDGLPLRTGSSFGAAGVSAVAALARAYLPDASPMEIMDLVLSSAVDLGRGAHVCNTRTQSLRPLSHCNVHRVSACQTLDAALAQVCAVNRYALNCSWARYALECDTPAAGTPRGPSLPDFDPKAQAELVPTAYQRATAGGDCSIGEVMTNGPQSHYCPDEEFDNGINAPGTSGQPGDDPCRVCGVKITAGDFVDEFTVVMGLEPELAADLSAPTLRVDDEVYGLGETTMTRASSGGLVAVQLPPLRYTPATATLSFQYGTKKSLSSQLPIW